MMRRWGHGRRARGLCRLRGSAPGGGRPGRSRRLARPLPSRRGPDPPCLGIDGGHGGRGRMADRHSRPPGARRQRLGRQRRLLLHRLRWRLPGRRRPAGAPTGPHRRLARGNVGDAGRGHQRPHRLEWPGAGGHHPEDQSRGYPAHRLVHAVRAGRVRHPRRRSRRHCRLHPPADQAGEPRRPQESAPPTRRPLVLALGSPRHQPGADRGGTRAPGRAARRGHAQHRGAHLAGPGPAQRRGHRRGRERPVVEDPDGDGGRRGRRRTHDRRRSQRRLFGCGIGLPTGADPPRAHLGVGAAGGWASVNGAPWARTGWRRRCG